MFRQQLETDVDTTYAVTASRHSHLVACSRLFKDRQKDVTGRILHLLSKGFAHCSDCVARLNDDLTAIIIGLRLRLVFARPTALHSPSLIFIVISPPVIRSPSVRRISFPLEHSSPPPTPNLRIASIFSFHGAEASESVKSIELIL